MRKLDLAAAALLIVGGLNWGLVAVAEFDLVAWLFGEEFGETNVVSRIVYGLVGLAAVYGIASLLARRGRVPAGRPATAAMAVAATLALAGVAAAPAAAATPDQERNIVQTAVGAGKFKTLTKLVKRAGLARTLQKPGPYTVFAPTDAAFAKVPKRVLKALLDDRAQLRSVLLYHVAGGRLPAADVVERSSIKTLNGQRVRVRVKDSRVFLNRARVTTPDVMASNGVIHVINRVLIPRAG
jgi:uncharacterized surface protein with fasciclin (FAS1) repeats/uncharacterized membrane protein YuzA (DUF378 family)